MIIDTTRYITKLEMKKKKKKKKKPAHIRFLVLFFSIFLKKLGDFFSGQREAGSGQVGGVRLRAWW
jgi:hypothetical protein